MNIRDAKEQIKNAIMAYFTKDKFGKYIIPVQKQRPVFLMGPPGIGKTAIMEQIAAEMGVGLLSYSMTHHTRQSALGLPFIEHKNYQGREYDVSEYTMSEIIASIYELMEETGVREGILFLDEINCVSETLSPIMLQFLQYKVFGRHRVPDGWIVVTAGNPPEYNNSVRQFDIVTWDRLKRIDCEPDFEVWKEYAYATAVHPAVISYLEIRKDDFYKVESTVSGKTFVTARGWDDLSQMIKLYEMNEIKVDEKLVSQYLQNPMIARNFAVYYELFTKYRSDYQVDKILAGDASSEIIKRAQSAKFDERLTLISLILDAVSEKVRAVMIEDGCLFKLMADVKEFRKADADAKPYDKLIKMISEREESQLRAAESGAASSDELELKLEEAEHLKSMAALIRESSDDASAFVILKDEVERIAADLRKIASLAKSAVDNAFLFMEKAYEEGQEILILVTELTSNPVCAKFIGKYGSDEYFKHNKNLLFYERQKEIDSILETLE